jgi:hypothetical protein
MATTEEFTCQSVKPWLCAGDFNEILFSQDGERPRSQSCMDRFRETLEYCRLHDLGFDGDIFTWRNHNHIAADYIRERLDRAVANEEWRRRFPCARVINGDPRHSDHRLVIIMTDRPVDRERREGGRSFHFEAAWLQEEEVWAGSRRGLAERDE